MLKAGIIGYKDCYGYAEIIKKHPAFELAGVFDPAFQFDTRIVPENLQVYYDSGDLIDASDAIIVASEEKLYLSLIIEAVKSSKPVFLHSSFNYSKADHAALNKLSAEAGELILVKHDFAFHEIFNRFVNIARHPLLIEVQQTAENRNELLSAVRANISAVLMLIKSNVRKVSINTLATLSTIPDIINVRIDFDNGALIKLQVNAVEDELNHNFKAYEHNNYYAFSLSRNELKSSQEQQKIRCLKHENTAEKQVYRQLESFYHSCMSYKPALNTIENEMVTQQIIDKIKDKLRVCFSIF